MCFAAPLCRLDHLATICHERAGERSQSAVISSSRNVWNPSCGVGVGRTWDQRALDTHMDSCRTCFNEPAVALVYSALNLNLVALERLLPFLKCTVAGHSRSQNVNRAQALERLEPIQAARMNFVSCQTVCSSSCHRYRYILTQRLSLCHTGGI